MHESIATGCCSTAPFTAPHASVPCLRRSPRFGFDPQPAQASQGARFGGLFFEVPVERIAHHPTIWYRWETPWINGYPGKDVAAEPPLDEFEPFDVELYQPLGDVPAAHRGYLRRMKAEGKRPLTFVHIPHVLVAGTIDTRGLRVISWETPPGHE